MKERLMTLGLFISLWYGAEAKLAAVYNDPGLTAAVAAETAVLKEIQSERKDMHYKIMAAELAVTAAMDRVHGVEKKMLDYLSEAQSVMTNLFQLKNIAELVVEIPKNSAELSKAASKHLVNTAASFFISKKITNAATEVMNLYPFVQQLVTSGSYNVTSASGATEKHKVNLLNSAERYYIANEVEFRLTAINNNLKLLRYQIQYMDWHDIWWGIDCESWCKFMDGKYTANKLVNDWNRLVKH